MNDSTARHDLDASIGSDYTIGRETPHTPAGFSSFAAEAIADRSSAEIKTIPAVVLAGLPGVSEKDLEARRLEHPNIVPILETGTTGETFYWITPAIDARTLRARMARGARMELEDSLTVLRDVSAALTHAHLHGVVHGGLSPDSILMSGGSALVTDLGIPEVFTGLRRQARGFAATPSGGTDALRYASPEQANGRMPDARSDVYAWGVIGYELLSGRHPFAGRRTPNQMMAAHIDEEPLEILSGPTAAPAPISRLVMRCLSKDPSKRPESARELLAVMTKEMLVPPPAPAAGTGQKLAIGILLFVVVAIATIAWLGLRA